jgi:cell division protein FtsQ
MQPLTARRPAPRRDPAPSRAAYRMHRLWLTPVFRALLRVGVPAFVVTCAAGFYLADDARRAGLGESWAGLMTAFEQRPQFMVGLMAIDGASPDLAEAVRSTLALQFPLSSFDIDLEQAQQKVETLAAVAKADLRVRPGGILQVMIEERVPAVVWRSETGLDLLDVTGLRVATIGSRLDRPDLPLVAGAGAADAVPEAIALLQAAQPIIGRVRGLVRMGERRWDLVLDREQRILLPEHGPVRALERIIALDQAQDLLSRDIIAIDVRNERRPVLRLAPDALGEMRRIREIETGASKS